MMGKFYSLNGIYSPMFDPTNRFQTSYIMGPTLLSAIRFLISLYTFTTIIFRLAYHPQSADESFSYFTNITFWSISFYFLISAMHTFIYARTGTTYLQRWPQFLQFLHSLWYTTIIIFPFMVTGVYWAILTPDGGFKTTYDLWNNVSVHALNTVFALFEIFFTRTQRPPWIQIPFLILLLGGYLGVAYITYADKGFYTYKFLDPMKNGSGIVVAYVGGILVGMIIVFLIVSAVIWARNLLFETALGKDEKYYIRDKEIRSGGGQVLRSVV